MTNKKEIVVLVPPRKLGYQHPSNEVHIRGNGNLVECPGQENENCSHGVSLFDGNIEDHLGAFTLA